MKQRLILAAVLVMSAWPCAKMRAQFLDGVFNQKTTQRLYMLEQLVLYRLYDGVMKKSYGITGNGLQSMIQTQTDELGLHQRHFNSLREVSPALRRLSQVSITLSYSAAAHKILASLQAQTGLTQEQLQYLSKITGQLATDIERNLESLGFVIISGKAALTESERVIRINQALHVAKNQFSLARTIAAAVHNARQQRTASQAALTGIKKLYGVPQND